MNGTLLSCQISGIRTLKDGSITLSLETPELTPSKAGELFSLRNQLAVVYISPKQIDQASIDQCDKIDPEFKGKTQSQRLRNVLFKLYDQGNEGFKDFESYYKFKTERIIDELKAKIL